MKKRMMAAFSIVLLVSMSLFGCAIKGNGDRIINEDQKMELQQTNDSEKNVVSNLVTEFGRSLQKVSIHDPKEVVQKSIQEYYGGFITQTLLSKWMIDPENAPGRLVSTPWPDHIDILSIEKLLENAYEVKGEIIEITVAENPEGGVAAKRPIVLEVKKINNRWLIDNVTLSSY